MRRYIVFTIVILIGVVVSIVLGVYSSVGNEKIFLETYKIVLSFTLVGILGGFVKAGIDVSIAKQKDNERLYDEWEKRRTNILFEFTQIYSEFYSLRKLYHSARSENNTIYAVGTSEYKTLFRDCLNKAVDLEGRFGGLKVAIIRHFNLPMGDYGAKYIDELLELKAGTEEQKLVMRYSLDILGELYDDCRHALEQDRKIKMSNEMWSIYEELLGFLDSARYQKENNYA